MQTTGRCPKCGSGQVTRFASVRAGGGPLSVGQIAADLATVFSQFDAYACEACGYTEFYLKPEQRMPRPSDR